MRTSVSEMISSSDYRKFDSLAGDCYERALQYCNCNYKRGIQNRTNMCALKHTSVRLAADSIRGQNPNLFYCFKWPNWPKLFYTLYPSFAFLCELAMHSNVFLYFEFYFMACICTLIYYKKKNIALNCVIWYFLVTVMK